MGGCPEHCATQSASFAVQSTMVDADWDWRAYHEGWTKLSEQLIVLLRLRPRLTP